MFSEVLKIIPKLDGKDLAQLERTLNGRFTKIAKKFGGGLMNVLKGGGLIAIAGTLIDKVLNPLKEVQESIDRTLSRGDDLATYAKQFNTTAGNLARLQAFGKATGLEPEGVRLLLGKFQAAVAQATVNPGEPTAVSAYVGKKDTAESFFEFVQALKKLNEQNPVAANLVQQEVFGEKQILKASEFLNADFKQLDEAIGGPSAEELTVAAERTAYLSDIRDTLAASRELSDIKTKAGLIGPRTIQEIERGNQVDLDRENKRLANFDDLKRIAIASDKTVKLLEDAYLLLAPLIAKVIPLVTKDLINAMTLIEKSRGLRGLIPGQGKDK